MKVTLEIDIDKAHEFRAALGAAWEELDYNADQLEKVEGGEEDAENERANAGLIDELSELLSVAMRITETEKGDEDEES